MKYTVQMSKTYEVEVEATDADDAEQKARDAFVDRDPNINEGQLQVEDVSPSA